MSTEVIVSVLGVILSAILSLNLVNWRLNRIEERLKEHNSYAKLFADTSKDIALIKKDLEYLKKEQNEE